MNLESCAPKKSVLVIDDDKDIRDLLRDILEAEGYEVTTAVDGIDGLDKLSSERVHLILVDMMMPRMNGMEMLQALEGEQGLEHIPTLMISANAKPHEAVMATQFMPKPLDLDKFLNSVTRLIS